MCDTIMSTYDTVAPKTAMLMSRAPAVAASESAVRSAASRKPMVPGTISARCGVFREPVTDSHRGR
jgi:hypothetical protein